MQPTSSQFDALDVAALEVPAVLPISTPVADDFHGSPPSQTVRVLHVINGQHYSGAERVQDLLAKQLPQFGAEVGFACLKPDQFPEMRQTVSTPLWELPMQGRLDLRVVNKLVRLIHEEGYALVHAHTPRTALIARLVARQTGLPWVYHVHSPAGRDSTRRLQNWTNTWIEHWSLRTAKQLITVSPSLKTYMEQQGFAAERVTFVPNGVPCVQNSEDRQSPKGPWTLGTVALFRPRKGTEVLLEALAALRSRGLDVRLRAVGGFETPDYESAMLCLAERLGLGEAIDWIGFTRDVGVELEKIDLLVLPSLFGEGLPMVVLEAMAASVPTIASHVEGVPEAVQHRTTGLLVEPGSVSQLSLAIEAFISGEIDYTPMSRAARERHAERFSDKAMAAGVAQVYHSVLNTSLARKASTQDYRTASCD